MVLYERSSAIFRAAGLAGTRQKLSVMDGRGSRNEFATVMDGGLGVLQT